MDIFHQDLIKLIETVGYLGLFAIVLAESGLLIGGAVQNPVLYSFLL